MLNVCRNCGLYRADKGIEAADAPSWAYAICPECGHKQLFRQLPLFVLTGPSGAGKSTVTQALSGQLTEVVVLEADILLGLAKADHWPGYWENWLRLCKNIGQSGRPVLVSDSGLGVPANVEPLVERRYFSTIHRLALVCEEGMLAARLRARPGWRNSSHDAFIKEHIRFNRWFRENAESAFPPIELVDTTELTVAETVSRVMAWIAHYWPLHLEKLRPPDET